MVGCLPLNDPDKVAQPRFPTPLSGIIWDMDVALIARAQKQRWELLLKRKNSRDLLTFIRGLNSS